MRTGTVYSIVYLSKVRCTMSKEAATSAGQRPSHHKLITEDLVRNCLRADKGEEAVLQSYEVRDFTKKGDNYMTVVTSVFVQYRKDDKDLDISYVVKLNPQRSMASMNNALAQIFARENGVYATLCPALNKHLKLAGLPSLRVANSPYAHLEEGEEAIFMEDLRIRGFKMVDRVKGLDKKHCLLVIKELARLHAASILYKEKENIDFLDQFPFLIEPWMKDVQTEQEKQDDESIMKMFTSNIETVMQVATHLGNYDKVIDYLSFIKSNAMELSVGALRLKEPLAAITHGDCWCNNILFRYDESGSPVEVMLVDLQIVRYTSPTIDLNYLFFSSLKGEDRQKNQEMYLDEYYSTLKETIHAGGCEVPFSSEDVRLNYRDNNVFGFLLASCILPVIMNEAGETFDMDSMNDSNIEKVIEVGRSHLFKMLKNPLVEMRFVTLFEDIAKHVSK